MPKQRFSATSRDSVNPTRSDKRRFTLAGLAFALGLVLCTSGCSNRQELNWADYRKVSAAENAAKAGAATAGTRPYASGPMPFGSGAAPYGSGFMPYGSGAMPYGSGAMPYGSGAMPYGSGMMPYGSGMMPYGSGMMPYGSGMMPYGSGAMPYGSGAPPLGFVPGASAFPYGSGSPVGTIRPIFNRPAYSTRTSTGQTAGRFPKYGTPYPTVQ